MQNKITKRRRVSNYNLEAEKEKWANNGWNLIKEEPDTDIYTILYFEKERL